MLRDDRYMEQAEIVWEKGTNRSNFLRGQVDKYTWVSPGSSYLPSDINAAYLWPQLAQAEEINQDRLKSWSHYYEALKPLEDAGELELSIIPAECEHNAHMFYIKVKDIIVRSQLINFLKKNEIAAVFHYVPLHTSPAGKKFGTFSGKDRFTTKESERLLRLPMYYGLQDQEIDEVCARIYDFFR